MNHAKEQIARSLLLSTDAVALTALEIHVPNKKLQMDNPCWTSWKLAEEISIEIYPYAFKLQDMTEYSGRGI